MHPLESLNVDGEDAELAAFAVPEMSLSSARSAMTAHDFILTVRAAAMVDLLNPEYDALVRELKIDDEETSGPQDALALAGYPSLERLSRNPDILLDVLGHYLLQEFVGKLSWDGSLPIKYWLDSVTRCEADGITIRLFGICCSRA
jgi:hypothetical protein